MSKARRYLLGKPNPVRKETASVVWAGREPPSPEHTRIMRCYNCKHDVYTRPDTLADARKTAFKTIYICNNCCPTREDAIAYARRFLDQD